MRLFTGRSGEQFCVEAQRRLDFSTSSTSLAWRMHTIPYRPGPPPKGVGGKNRVGCVKPAQRQGPATYCSKIPDPISLFQQSVPLSEFCNEAEPLLGGLNGLLSICGGNQLTRPRRSAADQQPRPLWLLPNLP